MASIVVGKSAYVGGLQVLDLPRAKELVHRDDAKYVMAENDLQSLGQDIKELNRTRKKQVIKQFAAELVAARHGCGLSDYPEGIHVSEQAESDIDETVLHHPTSLCVFDDKLTTTYTRGLLAFNLCHEMALKYAFLDLDLGLCDMKPASNSQLVIAEAIYKSGAVDKKAITDSEDPDLGVSFLCLHCDPINRQRFTWLGLVCCQRGAPFVRELISRTLQIEHFRLEVDYFEKAEAAQMYAPIASK